jgi:hypothetical protein
VTSREIIVRMRHGLYKYFTERKWADTFLDGKILFRSLSYFRDYEDNSVRGDQKEGTSVFRPEGGLITNHTQGTAFTMPGFAFEATAKQDEIFAFCVSRSLTDELRAKLKAVACVEILRVQTLCERMRKALPANATFQAKRVEYYDQSDAPNPRWALPDRIAVSKFKDFKWQNEFRFVFCCTDAFGFEKGDYRLVKGDARGAPKPAEHHNHLLTTQSLHDICRLHEF